MEDRVDVGGWTVDRSPTHCYYHEKSDSLANVYPARLNPEAACWRGEVGQARLALVQGVLDDVAVGGEAVAKVLPNNGDRSKREATFAEMMRPGVDGSIPQRIAPVLDVVPYSEEPEVRQIFAGFAGPPAILFMPRMHQFAAGLGYPDTARPLVWESVLHRFGGPGPLVRDRRASWQLRGEEYQAALSGATENWLERHGLDRIMRAPAAAITIAVLEACYEIASALCEASELFDGGELWHRDLKPSQVLVDRQGQLRVTDFGLAYHYGEQTPRLTVSRFYVGGTNPYFTPRLIQAISGHDEGQEQSDLVTMADVTAVEDTWALGITAAVLYLHRSSPARPPDADTVVRSVPFGLDASESRISKMYSGDYHRRLLALFPPQLRGVLAAFLAPCPKQGRSKEPPVRPGQQQARRLLGAVLGAEDHTLSADAIQLVDELGGGGQVVDGLALQQAVLHKVGTSSVDAHEQQVELLTDVAIGLARQTHAGQVPVREQRDQMAEVLPIAAALGLWGT